MANEKIFSSEESVSQNAHFKSILELRDQWRHISSDERLDLFTGMTLGDAKDFFLSFNTEDQAELILSLPKNEWKLWIGLLPPDDLADVIQEVAPEQRPAILGNLDASKCREVTALLAYKEDEAGGLMNPRFPRIRPLMSIDEALSYLRRQAEHLESMRYCYVLNNIQELLGVVSLRRLFRTAGEKSVEEVMRKSTISASETMSQEEIRDLFKTSGLMAIPVVDANGRMKGIVTVDDIVEVVEEEATEDIQKLGGLEALDTSYMKTGLLSLLKKRAGWLSILFLGEMLTASAMASYEKEIASAVVLALFIPLIISSGGNSGSQASTLVIRALALREIHLGDWWRIFKRELFTGFTLGLLLAMLGIFRIILWQSLFHTYGAHHLLVAATVGLSIVGVVTWGTLAGSMLPFFLRMCKLDPASASAPFVATLVDVSGLVIYFNVAKIILAGIL